MTMTKEEYFECIKEAVKEFEDGTGEFSAFIEEGREMAAAVRDHDATLSAKILQIVYSFQDLGKYIVSRSEILHKNKELDANK